MIRTVAISLSLMLAGCGAEVASTAATGAAVKAKEIEQAQQTKERAIQKIDAANAAAQQRMDDTEKSQGGY